MFAGISSDLNAGVKDFAEDACGPTAILSCMRRAAFSFVDFRTHVALSDAGKRSTGRSWGR